MATISGISGTQFLPGTNKFNALKYQYATSTYGQSRDLNPGLIVQPASKADIALALRHARAQGVAVAIKTGGHQYSGASSTSAPNMQLDLQFSFRGPEDRAIFHKDDRAYARTSVSWSLGEFNAWLGEHELFVPHGQCTNVHLGGHVQTGGYGQLVRSFGLLGDHVLSLEIVDSDGNFKEVSKATDPDLFFALLGGSPGNLGVVTHFTIEVYRDQDYKGSRGMKSLYFYSPETLKRLVDILVEMSDSGTLPRNYDFCISVLSSSFPLLDVWGPDLDEKMRREHPELYGKDGLILWPRTITVFAQWVPFSPDDVCDMAWFERFRTGADRILGPDTVDEKPMSQLTAEWIFRNIREFDHPYEKRTYATASTSLAADGWADWVVGRVDDIVKPEANRCWLSAQIQAVGGARSRFASNAGNGTAFSWRDTTVICTMDCFHTDEAKDRAEDWQRVNDDEAIGPEGCFSKEDRRMLWGSYGDWDLDASWSAYYEDREKYERLGRIRKAADPHGIFTANPFAVKRAE